MLRSKKGCGSAVDSLEGKIWGDLRRSRRVYHSPSNCHLGGVQVPSILWEIKKRSHHFQWMRTRLRASWHHHGLSLGLLTSLPWNPLVFTCQDWRLKRRSTGCVCVWMCMHLYLTKYDQVNVYINNVIYTYVNINIYYIICLCVCTRRERWKKKRIKWDKKT